MKRLLGVLVVLSVLAVAAATAAADITTGLVAYYPFSGNAADSSGNGNVGTPSATAALTQDRDGNTGQAYLFDGYTSSITVQSSPSLASPVSELTMAAWVRRDGWGHVGQGYNPIICKSASTTNAFQYRLIILIGGLNTSLNSWNTGYTAPFTFDEGVWYHVASTWKADTLKSYVDGQLIDVFYLPTTIVPDNNVLVIGEDLPGLVEDFLGAIDEVRIYDRALSDSDIAELAGISLAVGVDSPALLPPAAVRAYPNPTLHSATILFRSEMPSPFTVSIFDVRGRLVDTLLPGVRLEAGSHRLTWNGNDASGRRVAPGTYLYRVAGPRSAVTGKLTVGR